MDFVLVENIAQHQAIGEEVGVESTRHGHVQDGLSEPEGEDGGEGGDTTNSTEPQRK